MLIVAAIAACRGRRAEISADSADGGARVPAPRGSISSLGGKTIGTLPMRGDGPMDPALELAGFYAAHAVWCIADGETLIPLVAWERGGVRKILRMKDADFRDGAAAGKRWLDENPEHVDRAVLIVDGFAPIAGKKRDALRATVVEYQRTQRRIVVVLPYRPARSKEGFAMNRPMIAAVSEAEGRAASSSMFFGVAQHERGSAIWTAHLDESE